jgi:excisionase family DNA binding protein
MKEQVYTTVDIARVCQVSLRTVIRWVDDGKLSSFRTPGGHRRVREQDLADFLKQYNIPFPIRRGQECRRILVMEQRTMVKKILHQILRRASDVYEIFLAETPYEVAIRIGFLQPHLVILALTKVTPDVETLCEVLRRVPETRGIKLMVLNISTDALSEESLLSMGVNAVVTKPFSKDILRRQVLGLLEDPRSQAR